MAVIEHFKAKAGGRGYQTLINPKPPRFLDRVRLAIGARPYPLKSEHALRHAKVYPALGLTTHPLKDG